MLRSNEKAKRLGASTSRRERAKYAEEGSLRDEPLFIYLKYELNLTCDIIKKGYGNP